MFPVKISGILVLFISTLMFTSCGDLFIADSEVHTLDEDEKKWLHDFSAYPQTILRDSAGKTEVYQLENEWSGFNSSQSRTGLFGLQGREKDEYETIGQTLLSNKGNRIRIYLTANEAPQGPELDVSFRRMSFSVDIRYNYVFCIQLEDNYRSEYFSESRYKPSFDGEVRSDVTYLDSLTLGNKVYHGVLDFNLKDFSESWTDSTIISLSYAQKAGIVRYETNGGEVWTAE